MSVDYRQTLSWQKAVAVSRSLAKLVEELPKGEEQGLVMQLQASMVDLPAAVARDLTRGSDMRKDELSRVQAILAVVEAVYPALDVAAASASLASAEEWLLSEHFAEPVPIPVPSEAEEAIDPEASESASPEPDGSTSAVSTPVSIGTSSRELPSEPAQEPDERV